MSSIEALLAEEVDVEASCGKRKVDGEHGAKMSGDDCPAASKKKKRKKNKFKNSNFKPGRIPIGWLVAQFRAMLSGEEDTLDGHEALIRWWCKESTQTAFLASVDNHRREQMAAWLSSMGEVANPSLEVQWHAMMFVS